MGDIAYFVTFRQTDPLFSADLSDPYNPKIIGELKIPGFSEFLFPYGEGKLLGLGNDADENSGRVKGLKLSFFDINDPSNVTELNKTVLNRLNYSPALSNHKAALISVKKNLIGFCGIESEMYSTKDSFCLNEMVVIYFIISLNTKSSFVVIGNSCFVFSCSQFVSKTFSTFVLSSAQSFMEEIYLHSLL